MTTDVARYWAETPTVDDPPTPGTKPGTKPVRTRPSRRTVFKVAGGLGGALALNVLSALPPGRSGKAHAAVGTEHHHCAGFDGWNGYNNDSAWCVGGTYSRDYCGADGWFMRGSGTCWNAYPVAACGTGGHARLNAWRWNHHGTPYRCADGETATCGGTFFSICSWAWP